tara:strand:- start:332 stop:532 length:201 start_codon:yes stop_codon:yes gene_type:complete
MSQSLKHVVFDKYVMRGGDLTLNQIEILVKENLGISKLPPELVEPEMFDEFMIMVIEQLTEKGKLS